VEVGPVEEEGVGGEGNLYTLLKVLYLHWKNNLKLL
jgi:hypothetical protein